MLDQAVTTCFSLKNILENLDTTKNNWFEDITPTETDIDSIKYTWKKFASSCWETNSLIDTNDSYIVNIVKEDKIYIIFAEDHEPEELERMGFNVYHKTLKTARSTAEEFCKFFQKTIWEDQINRDIE